MLDAKVHEEIASTLWYHTIELAPGVVTPGWFDLRPIVDKMPWPDVRGKRCLDVGTYDGFLAFELERRGAAEVMAIDIEDHTQWDWPPHVRATGGENLAKLAGPEKGRGFRIAAGALGSKVDKRSMSVYDLDPREVGTFDVVVCGSLTEHLRDPLRALEAIRTVTSGSFLSAEQIDLWLSIKDRRRPVLTLNGVGALCDWMIPNAAGHRQMILASGFSILKATRPYSIPFGPAHPPRPADVRWRFNRLLQRSFAGGEGVVHSAVLAKRRV